MAVLVHEADLGLPETAPTFDPRGWTTPVRIRAWVTVAALLAIALGITVALTAGDLGAGYEEIGHEAGPQVTATSDLSLALIEMDAQLANVLLVGREPIGVGRTQALALFERARTRANAGLQQAMATAGARHELRTVLDGLGRYEALAAQAVLLDEAANHPAGRPSAPALQRYRQATDLMHGKVLPPARRLTEASGRVLDETYQDGRDGTSRALVLVILLGGGLVVVLVGLQMMLLRRLHRLLNPFIALGTLATIGLVVMSVRLFIAEADNLRAAKEDAFDSVLVLSEARVISHAANADESRYIVDPTRRAWYEQGYLDKSQELVHLPGASYATYDALFTQVLQRYYADGTVTFGGKLDTALRNITFPGERSRAEATLRALHAYEIDDRWMRQQVRAGRLREAARFKTSYQIGDSNYHFSQYDKALASLLDLNRQYFAGYIRDGENALRGWDVLPLAGTGMVIGLILLGVRPRLAEYR